MKHKDLIASIYLKHGQAVAGPNLDEAIEDIDERIRQYNDNGIDRLLIFDLSDSDLEHERHMCRGTGQPFGGYQKASVCGMQTGDAQRLTVRCGCIGKGRLPEIRSRKAGIVFE